jgi:hypothetical protein
MASEGSRRRVAKLRGVQDESLIEEMRAALKGDRERAEATRRRPRMDENRLGPPPNPVAADRGRQTLLGRLGLRRRQS